MKTGRFYIGSSVNVAKRWKDHVYRLSRGTHANPILQAIWNDDPARLAIDTLCECRRDVEEILRTEQAFLDSAGVGINRLCMNVLPVAGSPRGRVVSKDTREKLRTANLGKRHSNESRAKMRAAKIGRRLSKEHREKLSVAMREVGNRPPDMTGIPRTDLRRFTDEQVISIRAMKAGGMSYSQLEAQYGMSRGALQRMLSRETYGDVL